MRFMKIVRTVSHHNRIVEIEVHNDRYITLIHLPELKARIYPNWKPAIDVMKL